jgi:hypothetical protein
MKKVTNKTILKQGEKEFNPIEVGDRITWCDERLNVVAQSSDKLKGVPVVSLDGYIERLADLETPLRIVKGSFIKGYKSNQNSFTIKDIEWAIELAKKSIDYNDWDGMVHNQTTEQIIEQITSIQSITVNKKWEVVSYE